MKAGAGAWSYCEFLPVEDVDVAQTLEHRTARNEDRDEQGCSSDGSEDYGTCAKDSLFSLCRVVGFRYTLDNRQRSGLV